MFGWEFPPYNSGGLGVACYGLTKALTKLGARITFVLPKKVNISADNLRLVFADSLDKLKFISIDSPLTPYMTSEGYRFWREGERDSIYGPTLFDEVKRYSAIAGKIAASEPHDIIHVHDWLCFGAGIGAKKASGKKLVVHLHATEFDRCSGSNVNSHVYHLEKEGMKAADRVIAVSGYTKNLASRFYGMDERKIDVVHNGADGQDFEESMNIDDTVLQLKKTGNRIVVFAGRLTIQKGPDYFLRAAKKVLEYEKDAVFVVVGSGDMETQLVREATYLDIADRVIFTGFLRDKELSRIFKAADLFVMPSVSEPFGIIPLEVLMHKTPVLISKQSGVSEVLTHALKTDFWDVDEMTNKILAVLRHEPLKNCLAENGQIEAKGVTWDVAARKCLGIYTSMLAIPLPI